MEVVRRRSATPRPIIEKRPVIAKVAHEVKKSFYMLSDGLGLMNDVGNSEMTGKNRHGVAEDKELLAVEDPFLIFRQIVKAEKTWPFNDAFISHICQGAPDSSGVVLNKD